MGFCVERSRSFAGKPVISFDNLPLSVDEQLNCIVVGWILVEQELLGDEFRVNGDD